MLRKLVIRIGQARSVLIVTSVATVLSVAFTYLVMRLMGEGMNAIALTISALAPITIAPFLFWPLFKSYIHIHHLELEMRKLASLDELTGLQNRRAFFSKAEYAIDLASRSQIELALVYIDLDDFKAINDTYGHALGDAVLKRFAELLQNVCRKTDVVGRIGGEEFVLIALGASQDAACKLVEKLLAEVRAAEVEIADNKLQFTISAGLASMHPAAPLSLHELLHKADMALQQAKLGGKNRLHVENDAGAR